MEDKINEEKENKFNEEKIVEISTDEFQKLLNELEKCRKDKYNLKLAVDYLNHQADEFNKLIKK